MTSPNLTYRGQRIEIFRDFPPTVVKRRAAFTPVRKLLWDQPGVKFGLLYPAKLRVSHNGMEATFSDPEEALLYAERHFGQKRSLKTASDSITYLGIVITKKYEDLYKANFPSLWNKLNSNIQFWKTLPISLLGRVNAIKMIFLPQLLYLFENLAIFLTKSFFRKLHSIFFPLCGTTSLIESRSGIFVNTKPMAGLHFLISFYITGRLELALWRSG